MPRNIESLLAGRNTRTLNDREIRRVTNTFLGFEPSINTHYNAESRTLFCIKTDELGDEYGDVTFGPDIFPGQSLVDANSNLSVDGAIAHEVAHYHRWKNKSEIDEPNLEFIDEALTSLEAIRRFPSLSQADIQGLVADAMNRLRIFVERY